MCNGKKAVRKYATSECTKKRPSAARIHTPIITLHMKKSWGCGSVTHSQLSLLPVRFRCRLSKIGGLVLGRKAVLYYFTAGLLPSHPQEAALTACLTPRPAARQKPPYTRPPTRRPAAPARSDRYCPIVPRSSPHWNPAHKSPPRSGR